MTIWVPALMKEDGSKYEQIARAIERDIADDKLKPGDRLPPQRKLAKQLEVTIGTIGRAYALAERRGLTKSEVGRGCFISPSSRSVVDEKNSRLIIDLGVNFPPDVNDDRLFQETLNELACRRNLDQLFGALPVDGLLHQRIAAAQWLEPRIDCTEKDVIGLHRHAERVDCKSFIANRSWRLRVGRVTNVSRPFCRSCDCCG